MSINKCNKGCQTPCRDCTQTLNVSNKTVIIPVSGKSAYETYKEYHPEYDKSEKYFIEVTQRGKDGEPVSPVFSNEYFDK